MRVYLVSVSVDIVFQPIPHPAKSLAISAFCSFCYVNKGNNKITELQTIL
jgi:hypothetical protein